MPAAQTAAPCGSASQGLNWANGPTRELRLGKTQVAAHCGSIPGVRLGACEEGDPPISRCGLAPIAPEVRAQLEHL